jgi:small subunit ribosomal protein S21
LQEGEPLESALRRFKRKIQQEDIIKDVKQHSFYLKPGEKRRLKEALARKRNRKKARKSRTRKSSFGSPAHRRPGLLKSVKACRIYTGYRSYTWES